MLPTRDRPASCSWKWRNASRSKSRTILCATRKAAGSPSNPTGTPRKRWHRSPHKSHQRMYRRHGRSATPQRLQFVAREGAARVQRDPAFPLDQLFEPPGSPRNFAVRHAEPDQIGFKGRARRAPPGIHLPGKHLSFSLGCGAISRDDCADAISRAPKFQGQRAAQPSRPHYRDTRLDGHRRSIASEACSWRPGVPARLDGRDARPPFCAGPAHRQ